MGFSLFEIVHDWEFSFGFGLDEVLGFVDGREKRLVISFGREDLGFFNFEGRVLEAEESGFRARSIGLVDGFVLDFAFCFIFKHIR